MTPIVSKRHFFKFYLSIVLGTFFFIAMATALLLVYNKLDDSQLKTKQELMPIFSIACYAFAGYNLYRYIKNAPTITLDKDFIKFNKQTFPISDIDKVELTGKRPFKYAINFLWKLRP